MSLDMDRTFNFAGPSRIGRTKFVRDFLLQFQSQKDTSSCLCRIVVLPVCQNFNISKDNGKPFLMDEMVHLEGIK